MSNIIKFVVFDFDGVFTDGKFYFNHTKYPLKSYNAKDALSLKLLRNNNIKCGIITQDKVISIEHAPHIFNRLDKYSIGEDRSKLEILNEWLKEYNFLYSEVAYIGDDLSDIPILKNVGFSACPCDAINEILEICDFVCSNKGGDGAVREFVEKVFEQNKLQDNNILEINDGKITAVIPVRKGSTRCTLKNIRSFGDTNLLKLKIETLKKVNNVDEIIVSTDCDNMIKVAHDLNVKIHKRDSYYTSSKCPNYEYWTHIAENVGDFSNFMMVNCVSPFINEHIINEFIEKYKINNYKNMVTVSEHKKFFYDSKTKKTINYNSNKAPNSQLLKPLAEITYGLCISSRSGIIKSKCIYGNNPDFFYLNNVTGIDIDECSEFITAELFYNNNINDDIISKIILDKRVDTPLLIDCTIRDGGYLNNWNYSNEEVLDCYRAVTQAGFDYFEIGFKTNNLLLPGKGKWCYSTEEDINSILRQYKGTKICVMAKVGTVSLDDFIDKQSSNIDLVRVLLARTTQKNNIQTSKYNEHDLNIAKQFCNNLIKIGYEVCFNLGCGDLITDEEIKLIVSIFNDVKLKSLYLADTYGGFNSKNIPIKLHKFYRELNKYNSNLNFGFHIHSNNGDGLEKAKIATFHGCSMIDASINGLGRGGGNLKTEEFICYKYGNKQNFKDKISPIAYFFDKHILTKKQYHEKKIQHHLYYNIAGALSLHPNYILEILSNLETNLNEDIDMIFKLDKYTVENNYRNYDTNLIEHLKK
jgi:YrbI family 3-deoxy-D-manno-octulosonate 8-phosphate phosphatase